MFAEFYQELFAARSVSGKERPWEEEDGREVPAITSKDVREQPKKTAKNKAADHRGLMVEMLQEGSAQSLELIADAFRDVLGPETAGRVEDVEGNCTLQER